MKYKYRIDEVDELGEFVRSINAYASEKRAEKTAERLNTEALIEGTKKEYIVCKA